MVKKGNGEHDRLCDLVASLTSSLYGGTIEKHVVYHKGELDILHIINSQKIYYEIKSNYSVKNFKKGEKQIHRAMSYGICDMGYVISPQKTIKII